MTTARGLRDRRHVVVYSDAVVFGGAEVAARYLLEHLDERFEATVVGLEREILEGIASARPGASTVLLPHVKDTNDFPSIIAHLRTFRRLRPHIVQANLQMPWAGRYGILSALATRAVKTIAVEHLPLPPDSARQVRRKQWLSKRLSAHVAVGERSARELEHNWQLRPHSIRTIHNGVPERPLGRPAPARGEFVVGSIGRLHRQKGYDVLIEAAASVPDVTLVMIGTGPEREALGELARRRQIAERVIFVGWLDDPRAELAAFDVFALPSRWEAFPLSILEAMLTGVPVVATDVGSVREAVLDGETGLLIGRDDPPALARALRSLRSDPDFRRRLAESARQLTQKHFTAAAMAGSYEALYEEIL